LLIQHGQKNSFKVRFPDLTEISFIMKSPNEKDDWMKEFMKILQHNTKKRLKKESKKKEKENSRAAKKSSDSSSEGSNPGTPTGTIAKDSGKSILAQLEKPPTEERLTVPKIEEKSPQIDERKEVGTPTLTPQDTPKEEKRSEEPAPSPNDTPKSKGLGNIFQKMKDKKAGRAMTDSSALSPSKKYLTWGPTTEQAIESEVTVHESKDMDYLKNLKSIIEDSTTEYPTSSASSKANSIEIKSDEEIKHTGSPIFEEFKIPKKSPKQEFTAAVQPTTHNTGLKRTISNTEVSPKLKTKLAAQRDPNKFA